MVTYVPSPLPGVETPIEASALTPRAAARAKPESSAEVLLGGEPIARTELADQNHSLMAATTSAVRAWHRILGQTGQKGQMNLRP